MASTGAIPRRRQRISPVSTVKTLHPDTQILVGQDGSEPLDEKFLTISANGVQTKIPALHSSWCISRSLISYSPPPSGENLQLEGALDAWLEQMDYFKEDLEWMLCLSHHRFWSHIIFERKIHECLLSYLSQAPRSYEQKKLSEDQQYQQVVVPLLSDVHQLVLLVHMRMTTFKESKTCFITQSTFGDMIYRNYIIDMCQILDLCALYVPSNSALVSKMVTNIFNTQPKYSKDLLKVASSITQALEYVEHRLGVLETSRRAVTLKSLQESPKYTELRDIIYYLLDTFYTLHNFVKVYPQAAAVFHKQEVDVRISNCYEHIIPIITEQIYSNSDCNNFENLLSLRPYLLKLRATTLSTFRKIIESISLDPLQQNYSNDINLIDGVNAIDKEKFIPSPRVVSECFENYLHTFSSCLADKTFVSDYHATFDFKKDMELLKEYCKDTTNLQYIEDAIDTVLTEVGVLYGVKNLAINGGPIDTTTPSEDNTGMTDYAITKSSEVNDVQLMQMVSSVQDLMPDLGSGFVIACLKHYHYSSEQAINALLEGSLPSELNNMDRALVSVPSEPMVIEAVPQQPQAQSVRTEPTYVDSYEKGEDEAKLSVLNRANVYNDDEFDVFSRNAKSIDLSKVRRGKKNKNEMEEDTDVKQKVRAIGRMYEERRQGRSIYENEDEFEDNVEDEKVFMAPANYNDEYDDTYDGNEAGNTDTHSELMLSSRFRKRPTIFGKGALNAPLRNGGSEEEEGDDAAPSSVLPSEETEEEFNQRRGLRKGVGSVKFMAELREAGGAVTRKPLEYERNLPASHYSQNNPRKRANRRHKPMDFHRDHHKPTNFNIQTSQGSNVELQGSEATSAIEATDDVRSQSAEFTPPPFCEDPAVMRERMARSRADKDAARNRGGNRGRSHNAGPSSVVPQPFYNDNNTEAEDNGNSNDNGNNSYRGGTRPKVASNKGSGKQWRQGNDGGNDEGRGYRGGKFKEESSSHGQAQDLAYKRKMEHKNKARKQAAQNKFNRNN